MAGVAKKSFDTPDETRSPDKTKVEEVKIGATKAARITFQPGWRWSECVKPVVGTDHCEVHHVGTLVSGHMHVVHNDGSEMDLDGGDAYVIEPGHDAWIVGDETCVVIDWQGVADYAKRR